MSRHEKSPDWTGRAASQRFLILERLRQAEAVGVLAKDLYDDPERRYGRSPRNRISELKAQGYDIIGQWEGKEYRYVLRAEPEKPKPLPNYYAQKEIPWNKRERVKTDKYGRPLPPESSLGPLFAGAVRQ